jgi:cellulose biosynthesis protein BcsQ
MEKKMKIAVMSPSRDQGITTVSILLGQALAETQGLTVCLTYSGLQNTPLESYLGLKSTGDRTKSVTQLMKLLESNSISGNDIGEFCSKIAHNFDFLNTVNLDKNDEDNIKLLKFIIPNVNHDIVITDITTELWEPATQQVIELSDIVLIVLTQNATTAEKLNVWRSSGYCRLLKGKPIMYVVNKYDGYISAFKEYTRKYSIKHKQCCKISYSPFICRTANLGQLHTLLPYIVKRDIRVCELNSDIRECMQLLMAHMGEQFSWR